MPRAKRETNEESSNQGIPKGASPEVGVQVDDEERDVARIMDESIARLYPREDLRSCVICQRQDIKPQEFRAHVTKHKASYGGTPKGYFPCWSGGEFWFPLKFANGPCKWVCSVCGSPKYYFGKGNTHGGPTTRLADRRYALDYCQKARYGDKAGHKRAFGKIDGQAGPVIFMHEGAPNPEQPVQDDPSLSPFLQEKPKRAKSVQGKANPKKSSKRVSRSTR